MCVCVCLRACLCFSPFVWTDSIIQKLKQHYNQSGGPSLGVTLAEVQDELRASPPEVVNLEGVQLSNGAANGHAEAPGTGELEPSVFNGDIFWAIPFHFIHFVYVFDFNTDVLLCI